MLLEGIDAFVGGVREDVGFGVTKAAVEAVAEFPIVIWYLRRLAC